jgi:hypothetical protein
MSSTRPALALLALVPLASCALVGPLVDRQMDDAPYAACTRFESDGALAGQIQCFALLERGPNGGFVPRASSHLQAGDEVFAAKSAAPECQHAFSHLVVGGDTTGPGEMRLEVPDAVGRGPIGRTVDWEEARVGRRWAVSDIDTPLHIPGGVRLEMLEGEVQLTSLCYKAYGDIDL